MASLPVKSEGAHHPLIRYTVANACDLLVYLLVLSKWSKADARKFSNKMGAQWVLTNPPRGMR
jgi:hypothetical protein